MTSPIFEKLAVHIATDILDQPDRAITPDEPLFSSGLIDSFHLVDLCLFVEGQFGARIYDDIRDTSSFDNLEQLTALIENKQKHE